MRLLLFHSFSSTMCVLHKKCAIIAGAFLIYGRKLIMGLVWPQMLFISELPPPTSAAVAPEATWCEQWARGRHWTRTHKKHEVFLRRVFGGGVRLGCEWHFCARAQENPAKQELGAIGHPHSGWSLAPAEESSPVPPARIHGAAHQCLQVQREHKFS